MPTFHQKSVDFYRKPQKSGGFSSKITDSTHFSTKNHRFYPPLPQILPTAPQQTQILRPKIAKQRKISYHNPLNSLQPLSFPKKFLPDTPNSPQYTNFTKK